VLRLVSWNLAHRQAAWAELDRLGADIALAQEAGAPPPELASTWFPDSAAGWETALPGGRPRWRTAVVRLSYRVEVRARATVTLEAATPGSAVDDSGGGRQSFGNGRRRHFLDLTRALPEVVACGADCHNL
jgi:hypothetical protein